LTLVTAVLGALAIFKHRRNIQRLLDGTESRFQFKKREAAP
jgi:glycerol-3-phosphate acyltransferase PlsY